MKTRKIKIVLAVLMIAALVASICVTAGAEPPYQSYLYNTKHEYIGSANAYSAARVISARTIGVPEFDAITDMKIYNGRIYILDSGLQSGTGAGITILDKDYNLVRQIDTFTGVDGSPETLNMPEGIEIYHYLGSDNADKFDIAVCDTEHSRIVRMDEYGNFTHVYESPDLSLLDTDYESTIYRPAKVCFDSTNRLYVAAKNINQGLICLDPDGSLNCFFGAPEVTADPMTKLWRSILSVAGVETLVSYTPTEYSNIVADEKGFIYGSIATPDVEAFREGTLSEIPGDPLRSEGANVVRLNAAGEDILKRLGFISNCGDLAVVEVTLGEGTWSEEATKTTAFTDVALGPNGMYSCLDRTYGRVFTYDEDGNLLFEFGNGGMMYDGTQMGTIRTTTALGYNGDDIVVADGWYDILTVFSPTDYGAKVLEACSLYYNGHYEESETIWRDVLTRNSNMLYAYIGTGKALHRNGEYAEAMKCFKEVDSRTYYSKSLKLYMKESFGNLFTIFFLVIIALIVGTKIYSGVKKFRAFMRDGVKKVM